MEDPNSHYFEVVIDVLEYQTTSIPLRLVMPAWTPGSYLIREFSRNILDLVAFDIDEDTPLRSAKVSKNVWEVATASASNIRIKYRVYAFEFTVDTSYMDSQHAIINGASVFMYVEGFQNEKSTLTVIPASDWKEIATGLVLSPEQEADSWTLLVPNFDILVDSPIEVGNQKKSSFQVSGVDHEVSIFSQREFDTADLVSNLKKIVEITADVFSKIPYKRYVFLIDFVGNSYGGLEHLNSTYCIAPIYRLEPVQEYKQLLSLFSHEFFHTWNVKRMRPEGLGPFNYTRETYTPSLWIAEGITAYYDDLLLRRAGIYTLGDYLDSFCLNVNIMKSLPGSKWQSAEEASFDSWIKHYRQDENSPNVLSSYYIQGSVVGWMLDIEAMRATNCEKNLDHILRLLYSRTFEDENRGYKEEEFEQICNEMIGREVTTKIFNARVRGRAEVDFDAYLGYAGLRLVPKKTTQGEQGFIGVKINSEPGRLVVANVLSDSPAQVCGLSPSDEIIAVDGLRMDGQRLSWYITNRKPETPVSILASRNGSLIEVTAETSLKPTMEYRINKLDSATSEQKLIFRNWLKENWDGEIMYEEYSPSPSKKNLFDYI
jgi:predicted metalloprotease with PDZ domain